MWYAMVLAFLVTLAEQSTETQVTLIVLAQQYQATCVIGVVRVADQHICTGDWLDTGSHGGLVKFNQAKHVGLVGNCNCRHPQFFRALDKLLQTQRTVYQ